MKKYYLASVLILLIAGRTSAQDQKSYESYLVKETNAVVLKYTDPAYPSEQLNGVKNDKMEEYAKFHPPIPLLKNTGDIINDKARCDQQQMEWLQRNPYYPQFVPYHLYNRLLQPEDNIKMYEAAKAIWIKANPEKYTEITKTN